MTDTPPPLLTVLLDLLDEYDVVEFTNPDTKAGAEFLREAMTRILASAEFTALAEQRDDEAYTVQLLVKERTALQERVAALEAALENARVYAQTRIDSNDPDPGWHSIRALLANEPAPLVTNVSVPEGPKDR